MLMLNKYKKQFKPIYRKTLLLLLFPPLIMFILLFRILPISWVRRFARFSGRIFYNKAHKSRQWALENLDKVYGKEKSETERTEIAKACFTEVIMSFFDYMAYSAVTDKKKYFNLIEVVGKEHLDTAYSRGKGVICLIPHMSSWEFAAITPPMLGYETSAASKAMKLELLEKLMVHLRGKRGMKNITREGSYQKLIEVLNRGECLILMIDQDTRVKGIFVDFLNHSAYTPLGATRLQEDTEAAIVPMALTRKSDGNYKFIIYPEIKRVVTGDLEQDRYINTLNQNNVLSEIIFKYPKQWVWMHRRWKTTPESLAEHLKNRAKEKKKD